MKFELTRVSTEDGTLSLDIPSEFFGFESADSLQLTVRADKEEFILFGHLTNVSSVYLRSSTGSIHAGINLDTLVFVNSSLNYFNECVCKMISRYPYYSEDAEHEEWSVAAESVGQDLHTIDPPAMAEEAFWNEFKWDVANGDYY